MSARESADDVDSETVDGLQKVLDRLNDGVHVLSGGGKCGIPAMQDIPTEHTTHLGMGAFEASKDGKTINWDGGRAMNRDGDLSWTTVRGDTELLEEWLDYDMGFVKRHVEQFIVPEGGDE